MVLMGRKDPAMEVPQQKLKKVLSECYGPAGGGLHVGVCQGGRQVGFCLEY